MQSADLSANRFITFHLVLFILQFALCIPAFAVPETTAVRVTDVTTSSFSVVWITDVEADPSVEVYSDSSLRQPVIEGIVIAPMPSGNSKASQAAKVKGIMKVRVTGVQSATSYYVRTVTRDSANPDSVSYSPAQQVTTSSGISLYRTVNNAVQPVANNLVTFPVYLRPSENQTEPGLGDLVLVQEETSPYPITAFIGDGISSPDGILDMNNLFGADGTSLTIAGSEKMIVRVYRAGGLSNLTHYRKAPQNANTVSIAGLLTGFFADINLDRNVDDQDFMLFKAQYRSMPDDAIYNPDYNFVTDTEGRVDVREFSTFSKEYGRTDVQ